MGFIFTKNVWFDIIKTHIFVIKGIFLNIYLNECAIHTMKYVTDISFDSDFMIMAVITR